MFVEEVARRVISGQPGPVHQEIMNFVGKNELLEGDALLAQGFGEVNSFGKRNIAVVVALNQQDRGTPGADGRKRRGFPGQSRRIRAVGSLVGRGKSWDFGIPV